MKLYHGSAIDIEKTLKPHRAFDRGDYPPRIYFTDKIERGLNVLGDTNAIININAISKFNI